MNEEKLVQLRYSGVAAQIKLELSSLGPYWCTRICWVLKESKGVQGLIAMQLRCVTGMVSDVYDKTLSEILLLFCG